MTMKTNGDMPAMPLLLDTKSTQSGGSVADDYFEGMTKREMMAMHMMASNRSRGSDYRSWIDMANDAIEMADALLAELERSKAATQQCLRVLEGWRLVPVEATREMIDAAILVEEDGYAAMHSAMLAAAPKLEIRG